MLVLCDGAMVGAGSFLANSGHPFCNLLSNLRIFAWLIIWRNYQWRVWVQVHDAMVISIVLRKYIIWSVRNTFDISKQILSKSWLEIFSCELLSVLQKLFFQLPSQETGGRKMPKSKDIHSNKHGYSWYTEEQLDEYYNKLIGMILQILNITL